MKSLKILFSLMFGLALANSIAFAQEDFETVDKENLKNEERKIECESLKKFIIKDNYPADCFTNYQLFGNSKYYSAKEASKGLRVASFNIWNIGYTQTQFKDFKAVSAMMNQWDIVATVEIIPIIGNSIGGDLYNNKNAFLALEKGENTEIEALIRKPGYLQLLEDLRAKDNSWSLILTPRELGANGLMEMTGYYFRSKKVKLIENEYCEKIKKDNEGIGYGCVPLFTEKGIMDKDYRPVFSKRPFMASFKSGNFDFTMLAIHTKFRKPELELSKKILDLAFGVDDYKKIPGLNGENFFRFAETQTTIEFINKMKQKFKEQDYIFAGDFNLNSTEKYWDKALSRDQGTHIFVTQGTTVADSKYDSKTGLETNGTANNYDHFIFDPKIVNECNGEDARPENFYANSNVSKTIYRNYIIRNDNEGLIKYFNDEGKLVQESGHPFNKNKIYKMNKHLEIFKKELVNRKTINAKLQIVEDPINVTRDTFEKFIASQTASFLEGKSDRELRIEFIISELKRRLYTSQQHFSNYYSIYKETLSDHMPIKMNCLTTVQDDD